MAERDDRSERAVPSPIARGGDGVPREHTNRVRIGEAVPDQDMPILPLEGTARVDTSQRPYERFDTEHTIVDTFVPGDQVPPLEGTGDVLAPLPVETGDHEAELAFFDEEQETNLIDRSVLDADPTDQTVAVPAAAHAPGAPERPRLDRTATELAPRLGVPAKPMSDEGGDVSHRIVRLPLSGGDSESTSARMDDLLSSTARRGSRDAPSRSSGSERRLGSSRPNRHDGSGHQSPAGRSVDGEPPDRGGGAEPTRRRDSGPSGAGQPAVPVAAVHAGAPLVGGRYRILSRIGEGGMGKVLKVEHVQLGKTFALKIISEDLAGKTKARESFYREARLASSLSHPNVATVVDFGEDANLGAFMVMELLEGEELSRLLHREKKIGMRQALEMVEQVAEALHYIHSSGIIHCDIKTDNILLVEVPGTQRRKKQVKLLDFGLARSMDASRYTLKLSGTPQYVAPERIRGARPSPSSDIYGLGILLYELVTGSVPFDGTIEHILGSHLQVAPRPPSELVPGLESAVEKLILRALEKNPEDRHKDMAAFLYELRAVMDMLGHRKRGGGKRIVLERGTSRRSDMARAVFDASRVPMAVLDRDGTIALANAAFAKFVMGVAISVEGLKAQSTALASTWVTFEADLRRACGGTGVQRILEVDIAPGRSRRLLIWLDPGTRPDQAVFGVHPLEI